MCRLVTPQRNSLKRTATQVDADSVGNDVLAGMEANRRAQLAHEEATAAEAEEVCDLVLCYSPANDERVLCAVRNGRSRQVTRGKAMMHTWRIFVRRVLMP